MAMNPPPPPAGPVRNNPSPALVRWTAGVITGHPRWIIAAVGLAALFFMAHLPRLHVRADVDDFHIPNDPAVLLHKQLKKEFSRNEFFVIVLQDEDLFSASKLKDLKTITESLEEIEDVREVVSLANVNDIRGTDDVFEVEMFLKDVPSDPASLAALKQRAVSNPLYRSRLVSPDGRTTALAVFLPEDPDDGLRRRVLDRVHEILTPYEARGDRFYLAGWPVVNERLIGYMMQDVRLYFPLVVGLALATIWVVFRNGRILLMATGGILVTLGTTLGWAAFWGLPINNASVAVVPLIVALALSDMVHVFSHLDRDVLRRHPDRRAALRHILEQLLFPCFLTSVNTSIGFLSLTTNRVPAMGVFGWMAAGGMMWQFLVTFGLVAPFLLFFNPDRIYRATDQNNARFIPRVVRGSYALVTRRPVGVIAACVLALLWGGWSMRRVQSETDLTEYFKAGSPVRQDIQFVRKSLGGVESVYISARADERDAFKDPDRLAALDRLKMAVEAVPGVDHVASLADYFKEMNKAFHAEDPAYYRLPHSRNLLEQYLLLYNADDLDEVVTPGFDHTRLVIRLHENSSRASKAMVARLNELMIQHPVPGARLKVAGGAVDIIQTSDAIVFDQLTSIAQAVASIWLIMLIVLRSFKYSLLFLVPNLFPLVINFGIMGQFGIPVNTGTALIAASAFGIIVDATVHFFTRFVGRRREGWPFFDALEQVTYEKGQAMLSSAAIVTLGFGVLTLGHFVPVIHFGLLTVIILITGAVGDLLFVKALLVWGKRTFGKGDTSHGQHVPS